jgi:hypothetical protein
MLDLPPASKYVTNEPQRIPTAQVVAILSGLFVSGIGLAPTGLQSFLGARAPKSFLAEAVVFWVIQLAAAVLSLLARQAKYLPVTAKIIWCGALANLFGWYQLLSQVRG